LWGKYDLTVVGEGCYIAEVAELPGKVPPFKKERRVIESRLKEFVFDPHVSHREVCIIAF
jgi:hypothetical protein